MLFKIKQLLQNHSLTFYIFNIYIFLLIVVPKEYSTLLKIIPIRLLLPAVFLLAFFYDFFRNRIKLNKISIKLYILLFSIFLAFTIPSILISKNVLTSIYTFVKFSLIFISFIAIIKTQFSENEYKIIIYNLFFSILLVACYGIWEYYFSPTLFKIGSEKYKGSLGRVESTFFNTIYFGIFINLVFYFLLYISLKIKNRVKSSFLLVLLLILYLCLIFTFTRSSLLIFYMSLILFIILFYYLVLNLKLLVFIFILILLSIYVPGSKTLFRESFNDGLSMISNINIISDFFPSFKKEVPNNNNSNNNSDFDDDSLKHRQEFAIIAKRVAKKNWPFGVGFGSYIDYMNSKDFDDNFVDYKLSKTHPHSTFTLMYAEVGIVSTVFFALFYILITLNHFRNIVRYFGRKDYNYELSSLGFIICLGFFAVNLIAENAVYDTQIFPIFLILNALIFSYVYNHKKQKISKIMFISSTGGHLSEMLQLKSMFEKYDYHIITEKTKSNIKLKKDYNNKVNYLVYGTMSKPLIYPFKLLINCFKSLYYYIKVSPDYIITTGAHSAGPMCCIGKIFGSKIIFIESFANISAKTVTGRIIYNFADLFIVQWESMLEFYPKAEFGGWIY